MSFKEKLFLNIQGIFYFESCFKSKIVDKILGVDKMYNKNLNNFLIANHF